MDVSFLNILIISEKKVQFYDLKKILELEFNLKIDIKSSYHDLDQSKTQLSFYIIDLIGKKDKDKKLLKVLINKSSSKSKFIIVSKKFKNDLAKRINIKVLKPPFKLFELTSDIYRHLKLEESSLNNKSIKNFEYSFQESKLVDKRSGKIINLTDMENKFFNYLFLVRKHVTKQEILSNVWGYRNNLDTHTLESLVYRIRNKIEDNPRKPKIINSQGNMYFLSK